MINTVVLMGRLTYEPELRVTQNGISVINFQLACDRQYQARGEDRKTDFIDCQAWRQTAEFISRYFHKGDMIAVTGSVQTSKFTDKDGAKRKTVFVCVNEASFCGSKSESNASQQYPQPNEKDTLSTNTNEFEEIVDEDDDLPF